MGVGLTLGDYCSTNITVGKVVASCIGTWVNSEDLLNRSAQNTAILGITYIKQNYVNGIIIKFVKDQLVTP